MIYYYLLLCLFLCPKDLGQNFTQNDVDCPKEWDKNSIIKSDTQFPEQLNSYSTENKKSKACVKKSLKIPIGVGGIFFAGAYPYGKKKSSGKKSGGHGYIPPSVRITDGVIANSKGYEDIKYAIFDNPFFDRLHVVYQFFDCSGNDSWIGFIMNSFEVCKCKFTGDFYFHRDEIHEGFTRNRFIEFAQIKEK